MKELDAVGDALEGLLGLGGGVVGGVHPGPGETDAAMNTSIMGVSCGIQFFGVLALVVGRRLPLPSKCLGARALSGGSGRPPDSRSFGASEGNHLVCDTFAIMEINSTPSLCGGRLGFISGEKVNKKQ